MVGNWDGYMAVEWVEVMVGMKAVKLAVNLVVAMA